MTSKQAPDSGIAKKLPWILWSLLIVLDVFPSSFAAETVPDLTALSLEELMNLKVTSVSRRSEKIFDAPAAVHVITEEDIRRSGATTLVELLRLVPGIQMARIDNNKWAVSARGF